MEHSAGIGALVRRMEGLLEPLEARGDPAFFLATYLRNTRAVGEELERGGFRDPAWSSAGCRFAPVPGRRRGPPRPAGARRTVGGAFAAGDGADGSSPCATSCWG